MSNAAARKPYTTTRNYSAKDMHPMGASAFRHLAEIINSHFVAARFQMDGDCMQLRIELSDLACATMSATLNGSDVYDTRLQLDDAGAGCIFQRTQFVADLETVRLMLTVWLGAAIQI